MRLVIAVALVTLVAACGDKSVPAPEPMTPATEAQAREVAEDFIDAAAVCDDEQLARIFDGKNLARRGVQKSAVDADAKRSMLAELERRRFNPGKQLCAGLGEGARLDLLRVRELGADHRPLLRVISEGTFNYYELQLGVSKRTGAVRVIDLLEFYGGDYLSDLVAESMAIGVDVAKRGQALDVAELTSATRDEDWQRVRDVIAKQPERVRGSRMFRIAALQAATQLDDPALVGMVEAFERDYPDDPALVMLMIDRHMMAKDVRATLASVDRLDRRLGGDPYLDLHRASAYLLDPTPGHVAEAETLARRVVAALPELEDAWWTLVTALLERDDHAGVMAVLDEIERRFDFEFDRETLAEDEVYRELASPAYDAWWTRHEARVAPTSP